MTTSPIRLVDETGIERFRGTQSPGGGSRPVTAIKDPCAVATWDDITLSGEQTIDFYNVVAGDRVLVINQADPRENGIYVAAVGAWSRATDADASGDFVSGSLVPIGHDGNAGAGGVFSLIPGDVPWLPDGSVELSGLMVAGRSMFTGTSLDDGNSLATTFAQSVLNFQGVPTSDPLSVGEIWSDGGTLKVSAGPPP